MAIRKIAADVVAMAKVGDVDGIEPKYWADGIVSIEAMDGPMGRVEGRAAVDEKGLWWSGAHEVHSVETTGP